MTDRPIQRVPPQRPPSSPRACCAQTYKKKPWIQNECESDEVGKEPLGHATLTVCVLSLPAKTDTAFKAFLDAQNPRQQHSSTLESYLIKPIQRVLKYPLLLRELFALTDAESEEHYHLDGEHPLPPASTPPTSAQASTAPVPAWPLHSPLFNAHVLLVAIKTMNKVASHINEMQKIHEEFGAVFDQLIAEQTGEKKEVRSPPSHIPAQS